MPKAARIGDNHTCPLPLHPGGPVSSGSPDVITGYQRQGRVGDTLLCLGQDVIARGSPTVFVNGREAARIGDPTVHGGVIVVGCATVNIGETPQSVVLKETARGGTPFAEECARLPNESLPAEGTPADPNAPQQDSSET
jgi:uncharacterized Zn-binding protein involved in type VI secretion